VHFSTTATLPRQSARWLPISARYTASSTILTAATPDSSIRPRYVGKHKLDQGVGCQDRHAGEYDLDKGCPDIYPETRSIATSNCQCLPLFRRGIHVATHSYKSCHSHRHATAYKAAPRRRGSRRAGLWAGNAVTAQYQDTVFLGGSSANVYYRLDGGGESDTAGRRSSPDCRCHLRDTFPGVMTPQAASSSPGI